MKHIILIKDMNCEKCVEKISKALTDAGIEHTISLENKSVAVEKNGDIVSAARRAITQAGYTLL